ncbi:carbon-monoxide dehydrogenase medium subunit [Pseudonocardia thermophila]|jgi:Aerobic-type carbon monoxide dehydrogenase, middle subunit CoxM/CutM homologs|uniref:Carbon-monoxide dehydrogenase medium subunit n=1 Tax=Pseudonocardia thermophila TaxID=1848 RepID=A0A1M6Q1G2_PSETH|nr:xanthine dehydrogenase family protein subunit M [Pseudonocardia thermophila]SHK14070.1 carbon-monoxide dehydrogenase medium subunit [Pseudonocardia thermophila]
MQLPAHFEYQRARSVEHALALLSRHGPEARLIAGGHSLIPMMKLRLAQPELLIDINEVPELGGIEITEDEIRIGALVRHTQLLDCAEVGRSAPMLHDAERVIADPLVRNRGTVGGSVCQADPSEDLSGAFSALRAVADIAGPAGERTVPMRGFFHGPYQTAVGPDELLLRLRVPLPAPGLRTGSAYRKVSRRAGDWAVGAAGAAVTLAPDGTVAEVGIGLTALGAREFVATEAEDLLRGQRPTPEAIDAAGRAAAQHCEPVADQRGPVEYKRHLAGELTRRVLRDALARAGGR